MVGCFDVYRLDTGNFYDTAKKAEVRQFVWKYTAESQPGNRWLTTLAGGVSSEAGTTYDWGPGATIPIEQPVTVTAAITRDLLPQHVPGREAPGIATETDGWDFQPLPGRIDPRLTDNLFSVMWSAAKGKKPPAGEPAQVAGATIWGLVEPAPDVMPTHLRVEAHYR